MIYSFNGLTLADLNLVAVPPLERWFDAPRVERNGEAIPNHMAHRPAPRATSARRTLRVPTRMMVSSYADREARLAIVDEALQGVVEIVRADSPSRVLRATFDGATVLPRNSTDTINDVMVDLEFTAFDAASYDAQPSVYALGTVGVPIPQGTLPSPGRIHWPGGWSGTRTLTYRGINGILYGTMSVTIPGSETFAAGEYLVLDLARWTLTRVSAAGVRDPDVYHWLSAGDWFTPQPRDGDRSRNKWGTLAVSAGTAQYLHRRAWRF